MCTIKNKRLKQKRDPALPPRCTPKSGLDVKASSLKPTSGGFVQVLGRPKVGQVKIFVTILLLKVLCPQFSLNVLCPLFSTKSSLSSLFLKKFPVLLLLLKVLFPPFTTKNP